MQEVEEIPLLSLEDGVVVCDKTNNELGKYLRTGFAAPEAHHIWTEECYASIVCRIEEPITEDIVCTINVFQVFNDVQQVTISYGDIILFSDTINQNLSQISFSIPKECLKDNILSLQLELPDAVSPKELGDGEDGRKLALAITSIELAKVTDE